MQITHQKYNNRYSVRTSLSDFRIDDWLTNIPLYAIGLLERGIFREKSQ